MEQRTLWPARTTDPGTSHEAAAAIVDKIPELERVVRDALRAVPEGMTITETADWLQMDRWSVSPRFRPLARKGLIYEAGHKIAPTGRKQIVWKARQQGVLDPAPPSENRL
jgi:hypothetical protein